VNFFFYKQFSGELCPGLAGRRFHRRPGQCEESKSFDPPIVLAVARVGSRQERQPDNGNNFQQLGFGPRLSAPTPMIRPTDSINSSNARCLLSFKTVLS
jgi:hypothetical protein